MPGPVDASDSQRHAIDAYFLLALTALCWGGNAVMGRVAVGEISPMALVMARWFGVLLLSLVFLRKGLRNDWPVLRLRWRYVAFMGASGFTIFNALFYVAAHDTTAINIGIVQGSIPIFVMMGTVFIYQARISAMQLVGVLVTLVGVVVIVTGGEMARLLGLAINKGDFIMLLSCLFYSAYALGLRRRPEVSPLSLFAAMAGVAFLIALPLAAVEALSGGFLWPTPTGWLVVALVTLFPSFLAQILFILGVDRIGPARAGVFVNLVPVFAAGLAVLFLGEAFELYHGAALALVLFGIFLSERYKKSSAPAGP